MNRNVALDNNEPLDSADWMIGIGLSVFIHVLVCLGFIFFPHSSSDTFTPLNAIDVDLAYLPPSMGTPDATGGDGGKMKPAPEAAPIPSSPEPEKAAEPEKPPEKLIEKDSSISLKKDKVRPAKKEELKKEPTEEERIKKALRSIERNVGAPQEEENPLADRLRRLASEAEHGEDGSSGGHGGPKGNGGTDEGDQTESGLNAALIDRYRIFVKTQVSENWAFSQFLTGSRKNLETWVSFEVFTDGEIKNIRITKKSGNDYMDSAATMAILKSSPVRPHPPGLNKTSIKMGIKFKPNEVN